MRNFFVYCLFAFLLSCGPSPIDATNSARGSGVLHRGNGAEPDTLDPNLSSGTWENNIISDMLEGLMTVDVDGQATLGAADSYKVSDDGRIYTFQIRDDMTWSDGMPVTADDFVFSVRRLLNPTTAAQYASLIYPIMNAQAVNEGRMPPEAVGVKALGPKEVEFTLNHPVPYFLTLLTHQTMQPLPKHLVEKAGRAWVKPGTMVVNGPFVLAEWIPNTRLKLVKNPLYYDAEAVKLEEVYYYPIADTSAEMKRFQAGELDFTSSFPTRQFDWIKKNMPGEWRLAPYMANSYLQMNVTRAPFNDLRVRRALSLVMDRSIFTEKILKAGQIPAYSFVPPGMANFRNVAQLDYQDRPMADRIAEAKALLAEAGYGPNRPLNFVYHHFDSPDAKRIAIATADMWKQIGVEVDLLSVETRVLYDRLRTQDFEISDAGWIADYNDPQNFLFLLQSTSGQMNYGKYANPTYDRLMDRAAETVDLEARAALLAEAEQILLDDHAIIPEYFASTRRLIKPYVKGLNENLVNWHRSRFITLGD